MKGFFAKSAAALCLPAAVLCSCAGRDELRTTENTTHTTIVEASAMTAGRDTRLIVGDMYGDLLFPVLWDGSEVFSIAEYVDGVLNAANADVSSFDFVTADGKSASFKFELKGGENESGRYIYCAAAPFFAVDEFAGEHDDKSAAFSLPHRQVQLSESSVDADAALVFAVSSESEGRTTDACFVFDKITAYARMTITGLDTDDDIVTVSFAASGRKLAGTFHYLWEAAADKRFLISGVSPDMITVDVSAFADEANRRKGSFDVWFTLLPVGELRDFEVTVATAGNLTFTRKISVPDDRTAPAFSAGSVALFSVDMAGVKPEGGSGAEDEDTLPEITDKAVCKIDAAGTVTVSGSMPEGLVCQYSHDSNELTKGESCTFSVSNLNQRHISAVYVRLKGSDDTAKAAMNVFADPNFWPRTDDVDTTWTNCKFSVDAKVDTIKFTVANNYSATLTVDSFIIEY